MQSTIHEFMNKISPLSKESFDIFMGYCIEKTYKKNTILCDLGDIPEKIYFIETGIGRSYSIDPKGTEYNRSLVSSYNVLAPTEALLFEQPSKIACQCLTECKVLEIKYKDLTELNKKNSEIASWYTRTIELHYAHLQKMTDELLTLNATERYLKLQKRIPNIDNLINQYHIASKLGITPIQLSRIRKKLYSK